MTKAIQPSQEQNRIIEEPGNLVITAKPGSGKTFTIVEKISAISEHLMDYQGVMQSLLLEKLAKN
ncbi:hypothetical protein ASG99_14725 [Bacillus sp. Soil768D1]|nr:hypothetical protein ASG99_14725 [Bacillus sp. Soil768D1]